MAMVVHGNVGGLRDLRLVGVLDCLLGGRQGIHGDECLLLKSSTLLKDTRQAELFTVPTWDVTKTQFLQRLGLGWHGVAEQTPFEES
jgi:hypothetical protein